jgi:hypothetical protein
VDDVQVYIVHTELLETLHTRLSSWYVPVAPLCGYPYSLASQAAATQSFAHIGLIPILWSDDESETDPSQMISVQYVRTSSGVQVSETCVDSSREVLYRLCLRSW